VGAGISVKRLAPFALLLMLAGCTHWDWHDTGRSLMESLCNSFGSCGVACSPGEPEGWCQPDGRGP
jgi:hypothetical protein